MSDEKVDEIDAKAIEILKREKYEGKFYQAFTSRMEDWWAILITADGRVFTYPIDKKDKEGECYYEEPSPHLYSDWWDEANAYFREGEPESTEEEEELFESLDDVTDELDIMSYTYDLREPPMIIKDEYGGEYEVEIVDNRYKLKRIIKEPDKED